MLEDLGSEAIAAALRGDWNLAIEANLKILCESSSDVDALNRLTRAYLEVGRVKEATETLGLLKKTDPYNQIAEKNRERLRLVRQKKVSPKSECSYSNADFLEEPGKTKVVTLTNLGQIRLRRNLTCGQSVILQTRRRSVQVLDLAGRYLGAIPDDLGRRLYILIESGNQYSCCLKSVISPPTVLVREVARGKKFRNIPSFPTSGNNYTTDVQPSQPATPPPETHPDDDDDVLPKSANLHSDEETEELS
jgi:hypothetical protein